MMPHRGQRYVPFVAPPKPADMPLQERPACVTATQREFADAADVLLWTKDRALWEWLKDKSLPREFRPSLQKKQVVARLQKHAFGLGKRAEAVVDIWTEQLRGRNVCRRRKVCSEIAWRFVEDFVMGEFQVERPIEDMPTQKRRRTRFKDDLSWAPPAYKWLANHPALGGGTADEVLEYEDRNKPPSPMCYNRLHRLKADEKALDAFWAKMDSFAMESKKRKEMKEDDTASKEERKEIDNLEAELEGMLNE